MYYVVFSFFYLISLLPLRLLYGFSNLAYFIIYYIVGYRKEVVMSNLKIAFPDKTEKERIKIAKEFYITFTDTFIETIKMISISKKQILRRSTGEFDQINELIDQGYNIHLLAGHQFNWEFANQLFALRLRTSFVGLYAPISNKIIGKIFYDIRKKFGTILISAKDFTKKMHDVFSKQYILGLAADQNPRDPQNAFWLDFFNKPAPFVKGPGRGAVKNKTAVFFIALERRKRGYYHFRTVPLTNNGADHTAEELTILYKNALEATIRRQPSNYLWSHRRWRHEWKPEYTKID